MKLCLSNIANFNCSMYALLIDQLRTSSDRKEGKFVFSVGGKTNFNLKTTELFLVNLPLPSLWYSH